MCASLIIGPVGEIDKQSSGKFPFPRKAAVRLDDYDILLIFSTLKPVRAPVEQNGYRFWASNSIGTEIPTTAANGHRAHEKTKHNSLVSQKRRLSDCKFVLRMDIHGAGVLSQQNLLSNFLKYSEKSAVVTTPSFRGLGIGVEMSNCPTFCGRYAEWQQKT